MSDNDWRITPKQIEEIKGKTFKKYCVNCGKWFYCKGECQIRYKVLETDSACFCSSCAIKTFKAGSYQMRDETDCESRFGINSVNPSRRDGINK